MPNNSSNINKKKMVIKSSNKEMTITKDHDNKETTIAKEDSEVRVEEAAKSCKNV